MSAGRNTARECFTWQITLNSALRATCEAARG